MPLHGTGQVESNPFRALQEFDKIRYVLRQTTRVQPPEPDIQVIALPKAPPVTAHVPAEIKLWHVFANLAGCAFPHVHFELCLLRDHRDFLPRIRPQKPRHRTEVPSRTDDHPRPHLAIYNPSIRGPLQLRQARSKPQTCAAAPQKVIVEFTPPDPVANCFAIARFNAGGIDAAGAKSGEGLKRAARCVVARIDLKLFEDCRSDPPAANLVPGKNASIENDGIESAAHRF